MGAFTIAKTATGATPAAAASAVLSDGLLAVAGWEIVGTVGAIAGGIAGLVGCYIAVRANTRAARREYEDELRRAREEGEAKAKAALEMQVEFWRGQALGKKPDHA